ncbi:hypothetical protein NM208_g3736 [Fusarium decemcellulare]|uniref:Uncharacterized protein n=2 Tax=Fusarium decemcellulare TaxID=57161 RepID=A0ACC1SNG4_9HYPO|nr:hypothetical protein NM208_g4847 [Fusarium decemcellulare]KAJ3543134.1 hypothetical protein NM208_g3736 [Fusarium decemcellulare]
MISNIFLLALLALSNGVLARFSHQPNTLTCTSYLGTRSVAKVPSRTTKVYQPTTVTKRIINRTHRTLTLHARTKTTTITTTDISTVTAEPKKDIVTSTVYTHSSESVLTVITETETITESETTLIGVPSDSTYPAPPNFTGVKDDPRYVPRVKARGDTRQKPVKMATVKALPNRKKLAIDPEVYVQKVYCTNKIWKYSTSTVTTTVTGRKRYTRKPTITQTATATETIINTEYPPNKGTSTVYVLVTISHTAFMTATETETTTSTQTIVIETGIYPGTRYPACESRNILKTANGNQHINALNFGLDFNQLRLGSRFTPEQCCIECVTRNDCVGSWLDSGINDDGIGEYHTNDGMWWSDTLSNGPCGKWKNRGGGSQWND